MAKQKNRLYSNPANVKSFPAWSQVLAVQPFKFEDRKVMLEAIVYPENLFLNFSEYNERIATKLLSKIKNKLQSRLEDLPLIWKWDWKEEFLHNAFSTIIFAYWAIEIYINSYIDKHSINLWPKNRYSLQEKINTIIESLEIKDLKKTNIQIWNDFLELEELRDKVIHWKYSYYNIHDPLWSDLLVSKIFNWKFKQKYITAHKIIEYIRENEPKEITKINTKSQKNLVSWRWLQSNPVK